MQIIIKLFKSKIFLGSICLLVLVILFINKPSDPLQSPYLLSFGRVHPLVLHFPIVLILSLFVIELLTIYLSIEINEQLKQWIWIITILCTLISFISGYVLFSGGGYGGSLLYDHFYGAKVSTIFCFMAFVLFILQQYYSVRTNTLYTISLLVSALAVTFTGHQGGLLTHGPNFLTEYIPLMQSSTSEPALPDTAQFVYKDLVAPLFETKCASCHNNQKKKGNFNSTSYSALFEKGESTKPGIVKSDTLQSELYLRIMSKDSAEGHMPPLGKTPLDRLEKELIKQWILTGAFSTLRVDDVTHPDFKLAVTRLTPVMNQYKQSMRTKRLLAEDVKSKLDALNLDLEVIIKPDIDSDGNAYTLSMPFPPVPFDSKKLKLLKPFYHLFTKLSLVSSSIEDEDLYYIAQMQNLTELYLQKTKINGKHLMYLKDLPNLKILNLSFTTVDNKSAIDLLQFPALEEVYLYQTKVSMDLIKALNEYKPHLRIHAEEGPIF